MGFSAQWLALREPADRAARDPVLARRACEVAGPDPVIVDLGCGTGATYRALSPHLPEHARWLFVDEDPSLLNIAASAAGPGAEIVEADIRKLSTLPVEQATLITASALLDLVSFEWLKEFADRLRVPFYAALTYSGTMNWRPADSRDGEIRDFFNRHQQGDKGLGPALGPRAGDCAEEVFNDAHFSVECADSPWRLDPSMADLQRELTDGIASAAAEAGAAGAEGWGRYRRDMADRSACDIGHTDILVLPRSPVRGAP